MGAGNVKAAYALWRGHPDLPDRSFTVLAYMALVALDRDDPPRYFGGWEQLCRVALGRVVPDDEHGRAAAEKSVQRAVRPLVRAGAITLTNAPRTGARAEYALQLTLVSGVQNVSPSEGAEGDEMCTAGEDTICTPGGGHIVSDEGDETCTPKERPQEPQQDLDQDPTHPSASTTGARAGRCARGYRIASDGSCCSEHHEAAS